MSLRLPVYVRALPGGHVVAVSVDFPDVGAASLTRERALKRLCALLGKRVGMCSASIRAKLAEPREPTVHLVEVVVTPQSGESEPIRVRVGAVSWLQSTSRGPTRVVRVPLVSPVNMVLPVEGDVEAKAKRAIVKLVSRWDAMAVLATDEVVAPSIDWVEVDADAARPRGVPTGQGQDASLDDLGQDLTKLAAAGGLTRVDFREPVVERVLAALATPGRNSVLLVGPPAVGKSALIGEVAARLQTGDVPPALQGRSMWRISANELIAGAKWMGMWQDRARMLLARARSDRSIFAMGDPLAITTAGRWSESDNNLSRVLRPAMETGEITLICECTQERLSSLTSKEPGFLEIFHRVDIVEPLGEEAKRIVAAAADRFVSTLAITVDASAVDAAVDLTTRFEPYSALPGKAVRLLAEAVHQSSSSEASTSLQREDVIAALSTRSGLPMAVISDDVRLDLADAAAFLERRVLGQPEAVTAMIDLLAVIKAGLHDPAKPLGSFFFVGPTGVGKTELAKALAELLFGDRERMARFDMGEYRSGDAVAKLIGSGWSGNDHGELTRLVHEQPFSVVLLDEIEKAHHDVFDALLSVLGEGRLTDASGRTADFRNAVVIMTSNLGAAESDSQSIGFAPAGPESFEARRQHFVKTAEQFFRPEFFNRIDRIVVFGALHKEVIRRIARREIGRLVMREGVTRRQLLVEVDDAVVDRCAERGFHPRYGARPLQREIERSVAHPLARIVVGEGATAGDLVRFRVTGGEVTAELHRPTEPAAAPPRRKAVETRTAATIARTLQDCVELVAVLAQQAGEPALGVVQDEAARLLGETHEPGFWDEQDHARETLSRYYQLNGCIDRIAALERRAAGLAEMLAAMRDRNDKARLGEARTALEEIEGQASLLRLEVHGVAAGSAGTAAVLTVRGIGPGTEEWAAQLLAMYRTWADRTGRDVSPLDDGSSLRIDGLASYQLLRGERGLHRRLVDHGPPLLARVSVGRPGEADGGEETTGDEDTAGASEIVRQYQDGRRQSVADPRTGAKATNVRAVVVEGKIDVFLLEAARSELVSRVER